jgi:hypothetical protein
MLEYLSAKMAGQDVGDAPALIQEFKIEFVAAAPAQAPRPPSGTVDEPMAEPAGELDRLRQQAERDAAMIEALEAHVAELKGRLQLACMPVP